jgi:hypothetical protein
VRLIAFSLLLLTVSPITAPFATCDLQHLLGAPTAPLQLVAKSKGPGVDQPTALGEISPMRTALCSGSGPAPAFVSVVRAARTPIVPLRI